MLRSGVRAVGSLGRAGLVSRASVARAFTTGARQSNRRLTVATAGTIATTGVVLAYTQIDQVWRYSCSCQRQTLSSV